MRWAIAATNASLHTRRGITGRSSDTTASWLKSSSMQGRGTQSESEPPRSRSGTCTTTITVPTARTADNRQLPRRRHVSTMSWPRTPRAATAPRPRLRGRDPCVHHPIPHRGWSSTNYRDHRCGQHPDGGGVRPGRLQAGRGAHRPGAGPRCTDRRRRHPPAGEDCSSQTLLIIRFGEEFTACLVKCSMPLDNSARMSRCNEDFRNAPI